MRNKLSSYCLAFFMAGANATDAELGSNFEFEFDASAHLYTFDMTSLQESFKQSNSLSERWRAFRKGESDLGGWRFDRPNRSVYFDLVETSENSSVRLSVGRQKQWFKPETFFKENNVYYPKHKIHLSWQISF